MKILFVFLFSVSIVFPLNCYSASGVLIEEYSIDLSDSIKYLEEEIQKDQNNYRLRFVLGSLYFELGVPKYDKDTREVTHNLEILKKARNEFIKVLSIKKEDSMAYYYLGHLSFLLEQDLNKATELYKKAIESDRYNLRAYKKLSILYLTEKRFKDAVLLLEDAKTVSPEDADICHKLAIAYLTTGEYIKAIENAKKALLIVKNIQTQLILASAYSITGDYDNSKIQLEEVLTSDRKNRTALLGLSVVYRKTGKKEKCIETLKKALQYYPDDSEIKSELDKCE
jgi:tetratricopeptide (TPR) repeat protein